MVTEEDVRMANMEYQIAQDNYDRLQDKADKIAYVAQLYSEASPQKQEAAKGAMQKAMDEYSNIKVQQQEQLNRMYAAEDVINQGYNQNIAARQATQQARQSGHGRYAPDPTIPEELDGWREDEWINEAPEGWRPVFNNKGEIVGWQGPIENLNQPVTIPAQDNSIKLQSNYVPSQAIINNVNGVGGTLTEGQGITNSQYLGNVLKGRSENINPETWVYQNNSRMPGYNLGRKLGNATIPVSVFLGAASLGGVTPETYTVANSGKGIYNTPNAWQQVNRAGSNYSPAYWGNGVRNVTSYKPAYQKFSNLPNISLTSLGG